MNQTADLTEKTSAGEEKYQGSFLSLHVDQVPAAERQDLFPRGE